MRLQFDLSRSEEHTSELQSLRHLVCRLLLEKKKNTHPAAVQLSQLSIPVMSSIDIRRLRVESASGSAPTSGSKIIFKRSTPVSFFFLMIGRPPKSPLFPYPPLSR